MGKDPEKEPVLKWFTLGLGWFCAFLIIMQFLSGWQLRRGGHISVQSHLHTGYMTVVAVLVYVALSTYLLLSARGRHGEDS